MTTPLLDWQLLPCVEFVEYLDHTLREKLVGRLLNMDRRLAQVQASESWNRLLIHAWHGNITGEGFASEDHLVGWCWTWIRKDVWFLVSNERQRRGLSEGRDRKVTHLLSELKFEQLEQVIDKVDRSKPVPQDLGPSGEGWFDALLGDLSERQREAVELTVIGDMLPRQAADLLGCKTMHVRRRKHAAIIGMRKRIESGKFTVPGCGDKIELTRSKPASPQQSLVSA